MADEAEVTQRCGEVDRLLARKDKVNALAVALKDTSITNKSDQAKDLQANLVEKVLLQFSESEIPNAVNVLSLEACDLLMKYIYKFLEKANNSAFLLKLHAQVLEKAGVGSIVKVLAERKQV